MGTLTKIHTPAGWRQEDGGRRVRIKQLELPGTGSPPAEALHIEMEGRGVLVARRETGGRKGKIEGEPARTREGKLEFEFRICYRDFGIR